MDATLPTAATRDRLKLRQRLKSGYFTLEALHGVATAYYSYYIFFYMEKRFNFSKADNLLLAACYGFTYMLSASRAGLLAHRLGYLTMLRLGFAGMGIASIIGAVAPMALGNHRAALYIEIAVFIAWTISCSFVWPNLQALLSREAPDQLPRTVGIYNVIWAAGSAVAYFTGGGLMEYVSPEILFWLPAGFNVVEILFLRSLQKTAVLVETTHSASQNDSNVSPPPNPRDTAKARAFLRLAWVANPFCYVAIYGFVCIVPQLAGHLKLSDTYAGVSFSTWMWVRLGAFFWFWLWPGWHYRFRWLVLSFLALITGFITILLSPQLWMIIAAQIPFGLAIGLIYYSSLYYSMDVGASKSKRGGIHESVIGFGIGAGPATGYAAARLFSNRPDAGVWSIAGLLLLGLVGFMAIRLRWWHDEAR
jgi:predicted MFS family arabinose efflux permease